MLCCGLGPIYIFSSLKHVVFALMPNGAPNHLAWMGDDTRTKKYSAKSEIFI